MKKTRFYEKDFPEVDECVMVRIEDVGEMYSYVKLLEYGEIQGMMQFTEVTRSSRIRSINKLVRVGKEEVCVVLRVDEEKGNIDISKKKATQEDIKITTDRYVKAKTVHSICERLSEITKGNNQTVEENTEELCKKIIWPLYKKYGHCYDAFKLSLSDPKEVFESLQISEEILKPLLSIIEHRLKPKPSKIRADIELNCFSSEGIDAIKRALKEGEKFVSKDIQLKIQLVAPPAFVLLTTTSDIRNGIILMKKAIEEIDKEIQKSGGTLIVKQEPQTVTENDEKNFNAFLQQLKEKTEEIGSDEDEEVIGM